MFLVSKHSVVRLPTGRQVTKDQVGNLFLDQSPAADPEYDLGTFINCLGLLEIAGFGGPMIPQRRKEKRKYDA